MTPEEIKRVEDLYHAAGQACAWLDEVWTASRGSRTATVRVHDGVELRAMSIPELIRMKKHNVILAGAALGINPRTGRVD